MACSCSHEPRLDPWHVPAHTDSRLRKSQQGVGVSFRQQVPGWSQAALRLLVGYGLGQPSGSPQRLMPLTLPGQLPAGLKTHSHAMQAPLVSCSRLGMCCWAARNLVQLVFKCAHTHTHKHVHIKFQWLQLQPLFESWLASQPLSTERPQEVGV